MDLVPLQASYFSTGALGGAQRFQLERQGTAETSPPSTCKETPVM
jgi:hypothetical protein